MADIETMNRVIAEYMGATVEQDLIYIPEHPVLFKNEGVGFKGYAGSLKFDNSYDWLMPVWAKLREELSLLGSWDLHYGLPENDVAYKIEYMQQQIATYIDIEAAHRLIYEAIVFINSKNQN